MKNQVKIDLIIKHTIMKRKIIVTTSIVEVVMRRGEDLLRHQVRTVSNIQS